AWSSAERFEFLSRGGFREVRRDLPRLQGDHYSDWMFVRVMGRVEVLHDGVARGVQGRTQRALLSLLILRLRVWTPASLMVEALWQAIGPSVPARACTSRSTDCADSSATVSSSIRPAATDSTSPRRPSTHGTSNAAPAPPSPRLHPPMISALSDDSRLPHRSGTVSRSPVSNFRTP